jgi:cytochrome c oxidase subunit III
MSAGAPPSDDLREPAGLDAGRFGMRLLVAALSMLFAAAILAYVLIRSRAPSWPPAGVPALPDTLWISTALMVASSVTMQVARRAARTGREGALRAGMAATTILGVLFLVSQTLNWFALVAAHLTAKTDLYGFTFYILTGLHAAHVVGGLVPLAVVTVRALRGRYSAASHAGVEYCAIYWHFLDVVWVVMFAILMFPA